MVTAKDKQTLRSFKFALAMNEKRGTDVFTATYNEGLNKAYDVLEDLLCGIKEERK